MSITAPDERRAAVRAGVAGWTTPTRVLTLTAAVTAAATFWVVEDGLTDDAYISLSAARNLAVHGEWSIVAGHTANTSTSPLNVLALGLITFVTRLWGSADPMLALCVLNILAASLLGYSLARICRALNLGTGWGAVALLLVLTNPFLLSAVGLEVLLIPAVLFAMLSAALESRALWFGVAAGSAVLVRLDLIVFVVVFVALSRAIRRRWRTAALCFCAVALPWYLFSWVALGSFVPDTFLIKQGQATEVGGYDYLTGPLLFLDHDPLVTIVSFGPAIVGVLLAVPTLLAAANRIRGLPGIPAELPAMAVGGAIYFIAYVVMDTVPYHWYYVTPMVALAGFAALASGTLIQAAPRRAPLSAVGGLCAALSIALGAGALAADFVRELPWRSPPIFGNWATASDYERVGLALRDRIGDAAVRSPGEIGSLAYFCECTIVDEFSDRAIVVRDRLQPRLADANPISRLILRSNYAFLDYGVKPVTPRYELRYEPGTGPPGNDAFDVHVEGRGPGHFLLAPIQVPPPVTP